jgi:WG containing repeat
VNIVETIQCKKFLFVIAVLLLIDSCQKPNQESNHAGSAPAESLSPFSLYNGPLVITVGKKQGYVDRSGKIIVNPQFDKAELFSEGLASVCLGKCPFFADQTVRDESKYGYIDEAGRFVINPIYDEAYPFREGLAAVCMGECGYSDVGPRKWGFVNREGVVTIALQFGKASVFSEGLAAVCIGKCIGYSSNKSWEGKWGFIDKSGRFVVSPQFDSVEAFDHGVAAVSVGTGENVKNGYIDRSGKYLWNPTN